MLRTRLRSAQGCVAGKCKWCVSVTPGWTSTASFRVSALLLQYRFYLIRNVEAVYTKQGTSFLTSPFPAFTL